MKQTPDLLRFSGAINRDRAIAEWFAAQPAELRALAERWFAWMRACGPEVRELMHDGLATACVGDAPFAYVGVFKHHVSVGFFQGASLRDPSNLLVGSGRFMRHVKLTPGAAVHEEALATLIADAYRDIGIRAMLEE